MVLSTQGMEDGSGKKHGISSLERRKFNQLQKEHDSLGKSQGYAQEIEGYGDDIINNLFSQN